MSTPSPAPMTGAHKLQLGLVMLAAGILYVVHSFLRFARFESRGYDLGIFDQAVRQYAMFKAPIVPVKGVDFNLLGDHFHPILAVLAPFYWIWNDPRMLGIVLALLLVSTAIPVYLFTRPRFGHLGALLTSAALLLWWPFQAIVNWDFHEIAFGVPIMAWIIWAFDKGRYWLVVGLSASLLLVREDMGITMVAVGIVLLFHRQWLKAALTAALGLLGYLAVTGYLIPLFSPEGEFSYWQYTALGATAGAAVVFLATHPLQSIAILFDHQLKWALWLLTFLPLALLPFASPYVILGAPLFLSRLFNDRLNTWAPVYQYDAIMAPILIMSAVHVLGKLAVRFNWRRARIIGPAWLLSISVIATLFFPMVFPLGKTVTGQGWPPAELITAKERAVAMVPDGVCIEAADSLVPHLTTRTYVGLHGDIGDDLSSWMIIDFNVEELGGWDPLTPDQALERATELGFTPVAPEDQGILVLHRDIPVDPVCSSYLQR
ncbi:DUF2079 domain-containing protein [Glutamicibacter protophormiae]|uniref:DUF2079 domain-containing protein n=1 Tax=Glutamicibacter protophormiae TaxID=37930 RepID=UPI002A822061|nr:DUF2079 domain-containing protein [Glutamicibacter protophormiae]WPR66287.1 DUF2079 domain-containing protein [Glutamicibacter protophormiae]WPR69783.1 DUF2079 domain-containing protein [Glutamicibacter protophormiae]